MDLFETYDQQHRADGKRGFIASVIAAAGATALLTSLLFSPVQVSAGPEHIVAPASPNLKHLEAVNQDQARDLTKLRALFDSCTQAENWGRPPCGNPRIDDSFPAQRSAQTEPDVRVVTVHESRTVSVQRPAATPTKEPVKTPGKAPSPPPADLEKVTKTVEDTVEKTQDTVEKLTDTTKKITSLGADK